MSWNKMKEKRGIEYLGGKVVKVVRQKVLWDGIYFTNCFQSDEPFSFHFLLFSMYTYKCNLCRAC